jgi:Leucine rich repeat/NB-ARC domain
VFGHQGLEKYANLLEIGEKIVKKCGGLPLAIKALGNALRITNNDDEPDEESWQDVLNSELWEITQGELEVLPALKLSYDQMPSEIKQCFLIFSLFPKDFIFVRENIVKLWISLGFIRLDGKKLAEDIGSSYFDNLVQRSMIQKNYYDQRVDGFFMHDLIHDLAQFMASKYFSRKEFEELEGLPFEVRFLSIVVNKLPQQINLDLFCHPRKLRILQIVSAVKKFNNDISIEMHDELFKNLKHLRALDFSHTNIQSLPDSIGNLKQLRYLNLMKTNIRKLPDSICFLYYLQTLELRECPLQGLPDGISCLVNLRHLNLLQKHVCMPHGIGKLKTLITLPKFHIGWGDLHCHISELKDLVNLHGKLHILGLHNVMIIESVTEANLPSKKYLEVLKLDWSGGACHIHCRQDVDTSSANNLEEKVLQGLQPHNRLKELYVSGYPGLKFPSWLGNVSFSKMTRITLSSCGRCNELPTLGSLLCLKFLSINWMWSIHRVDREFCCHNPETKGFQSLESLEFMYMPKWLEWSGVVNGEFCSLQTVRISDCRELRCLPQPFSISLTKMVIKNCKELKSLPFLPSLGTLILTGDLSEDLLFNLQLPSVKFLKIMSSKNLKYFSLNYESLTSLEVLVIKGCKNLQMVVGISNISSLRQMSVVRCPVLGLPLSEGIPSMLQVLTIVNCPALQEWEKEQTSTFFGQV